MKFIIPMIILFVSSPVDTYHSGLYKMTITTDKTCGSLPKSYTFMARLKIAGDCFETNECTIATPKYKENVITAGGEGDLIFATDDGMVYIKYQDQDGNETTMMPNNTYSIGFDHSKINGVAITDRIQNCVVVYNVAGVKQ